jgi:hypothetical protein
MQTSSINNNTDFATTKAQTNSTQQITTKAREQNNLNKKSVMQMPKHKLCNKTSSQKNLKSINTTKPKRKNKLHTRKPKKLFIKFGFQGEKQ